MTTPSQFSATLALVFLIAGCGADLRDPGPSTRTDGPAAPSPQFPPSAPPVRDLADTVRVAPGQDLQALVDAHDPGTMFLMGAGVHRGQKVVPKDGMGFVGVPGAVLDGEGTAEYAFRGDFKNRVVNDVLIRGLEIRNYASPLKTGAIRAGGPFAVTSGWVVENCDVHHNDGGGIRIGHRMVVRGNRVHHNGQIGIIGEGDGVLVADNEIAFNNTRDIRLSVGIVEFGGTKFVKTRDLVVRNNHVHDNTENGLWLDVSNVNALIEQNRVIGNTGNGIMIEVSYGVTVRDNRVEGNGFGRARWLYGAGILVSASPGVQVYRNDVRNNARGITAVMQDRGSGPLGRHEVRDLHVHDNVIVMEEGWTGLGQDIGDSSYFTDKNNRFERNTYYLGSNATYFAWMNDKRTPAEWRQFGHDVQGTFSSIASGSIPGPATAPSGDPR